MNVVPETMKFNKNVAKSNDDAIVDNNQWKSIIQVTWYTVQNARFIYIFASFTFDASERKQGIDKVLK